MNTSMDLQMSVTMDAHKAEFPKKRNRQNQPAEWSQMGMSDSIMQLKSKIQTI